MFDKEGNGFITSVGQKMCSPTYLCIQLRKKRKLTYLSLFGPLSNHLFINHLNYKCRFDGDNDDHWRCSFI